MIKRKPSSKEKHQFDEERAKEILAYVFPEKYTQAVLQESPDIYVPDLCIGVEVTDSTNKDIQEKSSWASDITGKTSDELSNWNIQHIKNHDIVVSVLPSGQHIAGFAFWGDEHDIITAYRKKLNKLNSTHFKQYKENNIFIFAWMIGEDEIENGISKIVGLNQQHGDCLLYKFDYVYIFTEKNLYCLTLEDANITKFIIPENIINQISNTSFEKVFGISRNKY